MRGIRGAAPAGGERAADPADRAKCGLAGPGRLERHRPRRSRRGLSILEIAISLSVLTTVLLGFSQALVRSMAASKMNREVAVATDAARQIVEQLKGADFGELFAANNSTAADDPGGVEVRLAGFAVAVIGLAVDVEEDGGGLGGDYLLQVREEHGVCELSGEELDRTAALTVVGVLLVLEQVGEHLDEVRLPTTKKPEIQMPFLPVASSSDSTAESSTETSSSRC